MATDVILWITSAELSGEETDLTASLGAHFSIDIAGDGLNGLARLRASHYDAVVVNLPIPEWTGEELLEELQRAHALVPILIRDPRGSLADAVRYTKLGAYYFLGPTMDAGEVSAMLETAVEYRRSRELVLLGERSSDEPWRKILVGTSPALKKTLQVIRLVGSRRATVLITGETGTGKEMVARALHLASPRANLPLITVNCGALPENLIEAELFGHVKGAFTGAVQHRVGRFEQAHRSTIFLDEIGELPLDLQTKLLRVLQEREFQRVGSSETIRVDVRVIAATNVDLAERVREGRFREDLYYRLNVVPISVPPLRERLEDIPLLVNHFIDKICRAEGIPARRVSPETLARLAAYPWPGNVRQLENAVEMAVALSGDREILYAADFPLPSAALAKAARAASGAEPVIAVPDTGLDFEQTVGRIERQILEQALRKTGGNKTLAAEMLRLKRTTLAAKLKSLDPAKASACGFAG